MGPNVSLTQSASKSPRKKRAQILLEANRTRSSGGSRTFRMESRRDVGRVLLRETRAPARFFPFLRRSQLARVVVVVVSVPRGRVQKGRKSSREGGGMSKSHSPPPPFSLFHVSSPYSPSLCSSLLISRRPRAITTGTSPWSSSTPLPGQSVQSVLKGVCFVKAATTPGQIRESERL